MTFKKKIKQPSSVAFVLGGPVVQEKKTKQRKKEVGRVIGSEKKFLSKTGNAEFRKQLN
jgi:hypothetical protein